MRSFTSGAILLLFMPRVLSFTLRRYYIAFRRRDFSAGLRPSYWAVSGLVWTLIKKPSLASRVRILRFSNFDTIGQPADPNFPSSRVFRRRYNVLALSQKLRRLGFPDPDRKDLLRDLRHLHLEAWMGLLLTLISDVKSFTLS